MTDIVDRLRGANDELITFGNDFSDPLLDAANEIEALRQRVKELEEKNRAMAASEGTAWHHNDKLEAELAALKQAMGEPVAYACIVDGSWAGAFKHHDDAVELGFATGKRFDLLPLYTPAKGQA